MSEECKHDNQVPIEMNFPEYLISKCEDCGQTIKYNGLSVTGMSETFKESNNVIVNPYTIYKIHRRNADDSR